MELCIEFFYTRRTRFPFHKNINPFLKIISSEHVLIISLKKRKRTKLIEHVNTMFI